MEFMVTIKSDTLNNPMKFNNPPSLVGKATITTNHPTSSYGIPVLVFEGVARGSADVPSDWILFRDGFHYGVRANHFLAGQEIFDDEKNRNS